MARKASSKSAESKSTATIGFDAKLWLTADKLRNNMDAAEYKHVVLGLIFLKYISDTFEEHCGKLLAGEWDYTGANACGKSHGYILLSLVRSPIICITPNARFLRN